MATDSPVDFDPIRFETHPSRYRHWQLSFEALPGGGRLARLVMNIPDDGGLRPGYSLKLNSYDLGVDIELADALQRVRFEHPEVRVLVVTSLRERIFCSGANIYMLGKSSHAFKVNFCKFTNETRLYLEELAAESHVPSLAALNGTASGGGYELAIACERILLVEDGSSTVSLPEVPLLGVLPGTGGLTRLVDKRKVRRDLADVFSTVAEGVRGARAVEWGLVDESVPKSRFDERVRAAAAELASRSAEKPGPGVVLEPLDPRREGDEIVYRHVRLSIDRARRVAEIVLHAPEGPPPPTPAALRDAGSSVWALRAFRELDDALLDLRFNHQEVGLLVLKTAGDPEAVRASDRALLAARETDWFANEIVLHTKRVLKRLDLTARTMFAVIEPGSCFAGSLFELVLAADRSFMLDAATGPRLGLSAMSFGPLPMSNGLTRLQTRFLARPELAERLRDRTELLDTAAAREAGLVTFTPDDLDWEDEVRVAIEERAAFSPDALTGMEASLRFAGPETMETKIFGRLTAWQNWIFQRPNAVGEKGALTLYGKPERPAFDYRRT
ncbi:MAG: benzoyl-CoA-dihydrodiol lyase [Polyangiaceae bacterium]|nr:benzoyl-CoA-dihydrodiol lyase [Polyangiaceae bacterium]